MHKINNAIYSYYHTDSVKGFAGFADKKHFLSCVKESVLGVKNSFESVKLYTDKKGHFDINFFDLEANEVKTIFFKSKEAVLNDLKIKTLNQIKDFY
jgi:hypothetical protein